MKGIDTEGFSFARIHDEDMYYVDKTLLIKDILDANSGGVYLFTRPRRFGKTTNLTMLDAFFNIEYKGNKWFDNLEISKYPEYERFKNAFPVMHINLQDAKSSDFEGFLNGIREAVLEMVKSRPELKADNPILTEDEQSLIDSLYKERTERDQLKVSIKKISAMLERIHAKKVVLLIDEYDRAVADAFGKDSHRPMMDFLGELMSSGLKNNDHLQMAVVTGVMQIAKESIFSGLNNLRVNNIFSEEFDERYGFTETEVKQIISDYGGTDMDFETAKEWYDGYRFGNADIYNPYSIMCYARSKLKPAHYWVNSGGDYVVRWLLKRTDKNRFDEIVNLIAGKSIRTFLTDALSFGEVQNDDRALYSLMAMTGYLKAVHLKEDRFEVSMPNREVSAILKSVSKSITPVDSRKFLDFCGAVLDEDARKTTSLLQEILLTGSYLKLTDETSYELVLATLLIPLSDCYSVRIEREEGNGRVDIILSPKKDGFVPMIFELKTSDSEDGLDRELDAAFKQIHDRKYYLGMSGRVLLAGFAFFGKIPKVRIETVDL